MVLSFRISGRVWRAVLVASIFIILAQSVWSVETPLWIIWAALKWMANLLVKVFITVISALMDPIYMMYGLLLTSDTLTPDVTTDSMLALTGAIMRVIVPLLEVGIILTAIKIIMTSMNPGERYRAKSQMIKLFTALILIPVSPQLIQLLINMSLAITRALLSDAMLASMGINSDLGVFLTIMPTNPKPYYCLLYALSLALSVFGVLMILFRFVMVLILAALMPLTIFLYMFEYTKSVGRVFMKWTIGWIFTPVVMAVWILVAVAVFSGVQDGMHPSLAFWFIAAFNIMIVLSPLAITGVLGFFGNLAETVGQMLPSFAGVAFVAGGELLQGKGPDALLMAGAKQMVNTGGIDVRKFASKLKEGGGVGGGSGALGKAGAGAATAAGGIAAKAGGGAIKAGGAGLSQLGGFMQGVAIPADATGIGLAIGLSIHAVGGALSATGMTLQGVGSTISKGGSMMTKTGGRMIKAAVKSMGKGMSIGGKIGKMAKFMQHPIKSMRRAGRHMGKRMMIKGIRFGRSMKKLGVKGIAKKAAWGAAKQGFKAGKGIGMKQLDTASTGAKAYGDDRGLMERAKDKAGTMRLKKKAGGKKGKGAMGDSGKGGKPGSKAKGFKEGFKEGMKAAGPGLMSRMGDIAKGFAVIAATGVLAIPFAGVGASLITGAGMAYMGSKVLKNAPIVGKFGRGLSAGTRAWVNNPKSMGSALMSGFARQGFKEGMKSFSSMSGGQAAAWAVGKTVGLGADAGIGFLKFGVVGAPMMALGAATTGGLSLAPLAGKAVSGAWKGGKNAVSIGQYARYKATGKTPEMARAEKARSGGDATTGDRRDRTKERVGQEKWDSMSDGEKEREAKDPHGSSWDSMSDGEKAGAMDQAQQRVTAGAWGDMSAVQKTSEMRKDDLRVGDLRKDKAFGKAKAAYETDNPGKKFEALSPDQMRAQMDAQRSPKGKGWRKAKSWVKGVTNAAGLTTDDVASKYGDGGFGKGTVAEQMYQGEQEAKMEAVVGTKPSAVGDQSTRDSGDDKTERKDEKEDQEQMAGWAAERQRQIVKNEMIFGGGQRRKQPGMAEALEEMMEDQVK